MGSQSKTVFDFWEDSIKVFPHGISRYKRSSLRSACKSSSPSLRGEITSFSRHSSLRMRRALLSNELPSCANLGITLTLPFVVDSDSDFDRLHSDYKIAFNRFGVSFRRRFPNSACIFRHELQKRGVPHCHLVCWLSSLDFDLVLRGRYSTIQDFRSLIFSIWCSSLVGFSWSVSRLSSFSRHGVKVDLLSDNIAMYRYISDHASKHKKSQLGYRGKQWGYINRRLFVSSSSVELCFARPSQMVCFNRHVSKCSRFFVGEGNKRRLSKRRDGRSVVFIDRSTVLDLHTAIVNGRVCPFDDLFNF